MSDKETIREAIDLIQACLAAYQRAAKTRDAVAATIGLVEDFDPIFNKWVGPENLRQRLESMAMPGQPAESRDAV